MMSKKWMIMFLFSFLFSGNNLSAQEVGDSLYPSFFADDELLKISLYFDITTHIRKKSEAYCDGQVVIYDSPADSTVFDVRCRARGNNRKDICFFPPVMLNFKPDSLFTTEGYLAKLKLVTHCVNSKMYEEYMLKEYLIYKLWELVSPYALRTRLLEINYYDIGERDKSYHCKGFFIEPLYMMTQRTKTVEIEGEYFHDAVINALDADRVAFFSYMIGNTDWRIKSSHNVKFIKPADESREEITAIPYDFDHAGLVNASYANPSEWSSAKTVTERDYTGRCRDYDDNYYLLIEEFMAIEEDVYETIMNFEHLDIRKRKAIYRYIVAFYKELKKPEAFIRNIRNSCMDRY
ncbi:hypothetical protein J1N10_02795 [Carboxylicivirga sp. A043]|uniref:hypothetical protein n=1 Tax=Carboxylicivirga litoralis TaxID=2816963 RepID=UPI0021CB4DDF|nr:hypothetical protein [Carboxylicivirga sp. A043]MCU4154886.1 hypothetical protein [Carboxylicivirga sp. A043]